MILRHGSFKQMRIIQRAQTILISWRQPFEVSWSLSKTFFTEFEILPSPPFWYLILLKMISTFLASEERLSMSTLDSCLIAMRFWFKSWKIQNKSRERKTEGWNGWRREKDRKWEWKWTEWRKDRALRNTTCMHMHVRTCATGAPGRQIGKTHMIFVPIVLKFCVPEPHSVESWHHDAIESKQSHRQTARLSWGRRGLVHRSRNRAE